MLYDIIVAPEAVEDIRRLSARDKATVVEAMELYLRHEPEKVSRSRIKRLRGLRTPQYRLRVEDCRVFYDVSGDVVEVLAVVHKPSAARWLEKHGEIG
jgi:mRNA-degrading endonuclease RelE of RelBE toxin-antitoxin system